MKKFIIPCFLFFCVCSMGYALYINFGPTPMYPVQNPDIHVDRSTAHIAEGKRIVMTICIRCHYNESTNTMAGRLHANPKRLGDFYSGNITQDSATGIGAWNSGQLYYFLKTGIKTNGEYVFDMPKYPNLSDNDLMGIIAFLQGTDSLVRKTQDVNPKPQFSFLTKLLLHTVLRPPHFDKRAVQEPDTNNPVAYGKYLATDKFSCYECHSMNMVTTDYNNPEKSWSFFKGGNPHVNEQREKIYTPNITGDSIQGIGRWTEEEFLRTIKSGIKPDGSTVRDPMFPFYLLTDKEAKSIYLYLKSLS